MKTILLHLMVILFSVVFLFACNSPSDTNQVSTAVVNNPSTADGSDNSGELPVISFSNVEHDFGQIIQGEKVSIAFKFENKGTSDLVIAAANAGCGCTAPTFPKHPIKPGEKGVIEVSFNSSGRRGFQSQRISVVANTQPNTTVLTIKANVVMPEN